MFNGIVLYYNYYNTYVICMPSMVVHSTQSTNAKASSSKVPEVLLATYKDPVCVLVYLMLGIFSKNNILQITASIIFKRLDSIIN